MERKSVELAHQHKGANGSISCSTADSSQLPELSHTAVSGQYNSCCLLKSSKGDKISPAFSPSHRDVVLVPGKEHPLVSSPHTRVTKFVCRPSLSSIKSFNRMDAESSSFRQIVAIYGLPDLDLFASGLNHQVKRYVSSIEDPRAQAIHAFLVNWEGGGERDLLMYAFPPFSLIQKCLKR